MKRNCYWEIYHWQGAAGSKGALVCESASVSCLVVCYFLRPYGLYPIRLLCPRNSPGKNTGVGSHSLLQGIVPTQGLNPGLLHHRQLLYSLLSEPPGKPHLTLYTKIDSRWAIELNVKAQQASGRKHRRMSLQLGGW